MTRIVALVLAVALLVAIGAGAAIWLVGRATDAALLAERGRTPTTSGDLFTTAGVTPPPVGLSAEARSGAVEFGALAMEQIQELDDSHFGADVAAATELMTDSFAVEYRNTAREIRSTSLEDGARVETTVDGSGLVGVEGDRAEVLVLSTSRHLGANRAEPEATEQWAVLEILAHDGGWLVDDLKVEDGPTRFDEPDRRRRAAITGATAFVDSFMNIDHREIARYSARVRDLVTGTYAQEYEAERDRLVDGVRAARSVQVMEVDAAGVERFDETSAVVLVAVSGTVSNSATGGEREHRTNRMRITVSLEHGEWLASDVAFVQQPD